MAKKLSTPLNPLPSSYATGKEGTEKPNMGKNDRRQLYTDCQSCGLLNIICWKV